MNTKLRRNNETDSRIDWGIILSVLLLAVIGIASIYVAASNDTSTTNIVRTMITQAIFYTLGILLVVFIMQFDAEQLWKVAPILYGFGIFLLIMVLFLYSRSYAQLTGAKSWFSFGPLTFQPSEVMKPAYIIMLGRVVTQHNSENPVHTIRGDWRLIGKMVAWTLPVAALLELQNDFGTMLVFFAIFGGVVLLSGISWKIIVPTFLGVMLVGGLLIFFVVYDRSLLLSLGFKDYQFKRIDSWLDPSANTSSSAYQLWQSMKAIGSG